MGMLTNTDYGVTPLQRILAPGIKRCQLGDIREVTRKEGDTKGPKCKTLISLILEEPATTTDKDTVAAGFPVTVTINEWDGRESEAAPEYRELALAVLGKERSSKDDVLAAVAAAGGYTALKGRSILVEFTVSKTGFQEVKNYNRVNNGA